MTAKFIRTVSSLTVIALLWGGPFLSAQKPVTVSDVVTATFTIEAINSTTRVITLKAKDGKLEEMYCGPECERFDALKVGDIVTFRYRESVASALRKPGQAVRPTETSSLTRAPGNKPGGTMAQQVTATVTIMAIDPKVPSVTIKSDKGQTMSFRVQDPKNLEGYKVGDAVEITYTQALAVSVEPQKK
jgi:Cu/Ag efflux protein CusF